MFSDPSAGLLRARVLDPPRQPGQLASLGRFDILRVIGSGGMGVVLLARDSASASLVAIKVLRPELIDRADVRHRFLVVSNRGWNSGEASPAASQAIAGGSRSLSALGIRSTGMTFSVLKVTTCPSA